ncbi:4300_t:CDS:1 [Ambispora gerdemannii]|uniref:4300_t:CDS:1 n=1 Tax=Ambispora gerdemannii TaxID=144530 RepID=A0A9N9FLZ8_9GLOM|nr:4300_t:CDS:1 [Ambispora gerdemannii]
MFAKLTLILNVAILLLESSTVLSIPIIITPTHFEKRAVTPCFLGPEAEKLEKIFFVDNNFAASNSHGIFGPSSVADSAKKALVFANDNAFIKRAIGVPGFGPEAEKLEKILFVDNAFGASNSHGIHGPSSVADSAKKALVFANDNAFIKRDPSVTHHPLTFLGPDAEKVEKIFFADNVFGASSNGIFGPTSVADSAKKALVFANDNAFIKRDPSIMHHPLSFLGPEAEKLEKIIFADNNFAASSNGIFGPTSVADSAKKAKVVAFDDAFI